MNIALLGMFLDLLWPSSLIFSMPTLIFFLLMTTSHTQDVVPRLSLFSGYLFIFKEIDPDLFFLWESQPNI
jgi:hypothetical protein